jgi:hypothetical protein
MKLALGVLSLAVLLGGCGRGCSPQESPPPTSSAASSAASSSASAAPGDGALALVPRPLPVGLVTLQRHETSRKMAVTLPPNKLLPKSGHLDTTTSEIEERREEVKASTEQAVTAVTVSYLRRDASTSGQDGKTHAGPDSPVVGHAYQVDRAGDAVRVRGAQGEEVSDKEKKVVVADYRTIGQPDPLLVAAPRGPLRPGERQAGLEAAVRGMLVSGDQGKADEVSVIFAREQTEGGLRCAAFDVAATVTETRASLVTVIHLKGTLLLSVDGAWPVSIELTGPISLGVDPQKADKKGMEGQGSTTMSIRASYTVPGK